VLQDKYKFQRLKATPFNKVSVVWLGGLRFGFIGEAILHIDLALRGSVNYWLGVIKNKIGILSAEER